MRSIPDITVKVSQALLDELISALPDDCRFVDPEYDKDNLILWAPGHTIILVEEDDEDEDWDN